MRDVGVDRQFVEGDLNFFFVVVVVVAVGVEAAHTNTNSQNNKQGITNIKLILKSMTEVKDILRCSGLQKKSNKNQAFSRKMSAAFSVLQTISCLVSEYPTCVSIKDENVIRRTQVCGTF